MSWKRFLELYHGPLMAMASRIYRHHTGESVPPQGILEDIVAEVVAEFFKLGVSRGVVDNTVYKAMQRLREIASAPEYQSECYL